MASRARSPGVLGAAKGADMNSRTKLAALVDDLYSLKDGTNSSMTERASPDSERSNASNQRGETVSATHSRTIGKERCPQMTAMTNTTLPESSLRYTLRVLLLGARYFCRALPLSAVAVFFVASVAFLLSADPETVRFADYIRAIQGFRTNWLPFTVACASGASLWRLAWRGDRDLPASVRRPLR